MGLEISLLEVPMIILILIYFKKKAFQCRKKNHNSGGFKWVIIRYWMVI